MTTRLLFYSVIAVSLVIPGAVAHDIASSVARFEAQTAADAAALAGAMALRNTIGDSVQAARMAQEVARRNTITGAPATLRAEDITFNVPEGIIRVTLRGRTMPFDVPLLASEVVADAAAEARSAGHDPLNPIPPKVLRLIE